MKWIGPRPFAHANTANTPRLMPISSGYAVPPEVAESIGTLLTIAGAGHQYREDLLLVLAPERPRVADQQPPIASMIQCDRGAGLRGSCGCVRLRPPGWFLVSALPF
jgi:hypothetical protein